MGGFCQVRVWQKIIIKQNNVIGSHKWLTDAVVGDRHYYRNYYKRIALRSSATQRGRNNKKYQ